MLMRRNGLDPHCHYCVLVPTPTCALCDSTHAPITRWVFENSGLNGAEQISLCASHAPDLIRNNAVWSKRLLLDAIQAHTRRVFHETFAPIVDRG